MCGGTQTTTQQVTIPPEVLARYNSVNATAEQTAQQPFQQYTGEFVAPLTGAQQAGIGGTNVYANYAQPYFGAATQDLIGAQQAGMAGLGAAGADLGQASQTLQQAYQQVQPIQQGAGQAYQGAYQGAQPYNAAAGQAYQGAYQGAQPYNAAAGQLYGQGLAAAAPLQQQATQGITSAYQGAQPYQDIATSLGLAGAQAVNPQQIGAQQIGQFMSPYIGSVLGATGAMLNQQNQQAQAGQLGNAISAGAFGGDRSGIVAANLAQQQQLANAQTFSDILNQGYGQALSAAQQQQGVNLQAAQANRAALAGAGQQLAGIGQQGFGQGMTTAQQQAALAQQLYGQGLGTGQAVAGLGQQIYGQGLGTGQAVAGLGQQIYGQGIGYGQAQQGLAQQMFGQGATVSEQQQAIAQQQAAQAQAAYAMGSQTAQQLAALGQGAQGAGLQGAQAQLAAGQVAQQTQQAQDTAVYNQFLQQQSYPFQVAQFLANIAEGTGALSGSTTTTQAPAGILSDERAKDDIEAVGKTFDGQPIVKYRYKGDDKYQIGLLAQNVEKKHPDAVGLAGGLKTVDYDKATQDAARRGHFRRGGLASSEGGVVHEGHMGEGYADGGTSFLPGLSGSDYGALLQAQQAMYAPFGGVGLYGGAASGKPHGGSSYVPEANLPVAHLATAGAPPPAPVSGLERMHSISQLSKDITPAANWVKNKYDQYNFDKNFGGLGGDSSAAQAAEDFAKSQSPVDLARGGLAGYADGGMPYSNQIGGPQLDIPQEKPDVKSLQTPGAPGGAPGGKSALDQAGQAAGDIVSIAKLAAMIAAMKRGGAVHGRHGYDDGGVVDDVDTINTPSDGGSGERPQPKTDDTLDRLLYAIGQRESRGNYGAIGPETGGHRGQGKYQVMDQNVGPWTKEVLGREMTPQDFLASKEAQDAVARAKLGQSLTKYGGPEDAASVWFSGRPMAQAGARRDVLGTTVPRYISDIQGYMGQYKPPAGGLAPTPAAPAGPGEQLPDYGAEFPAGFGGMDRQVAAPPSGGLGGAGQKGATPDQPEGIVGGLKHRVGDYFSSLGHGDIDTWASLLGGIGSVLASPTKNIGTNIGLGLLGGSQTYMSARQNLIQNAQRQQELGLRGREVGVSEQGIPLRRAQIAAQLIPVLEKQWAAMGNGPFPAGSGLPGKPYRINGVPVDQKTYQNALNSYIFGNIQKGFDVSQPGFGQVPEPPAGVGVSDPGSGAVAAAPAGSAPPPAKDIAVQQGPEPTNRTEKLKFGIYSAEHQLQKISPVDESLVAPEDRPSQLWQDYQLALNSGQTELANAKRERYQDITTGRAPANGIDGKPFYGYSNQTTARANAQNMINQNAAEAAKLNSEAQQFIGSGGEYQQTKAVIDSLLNIYSTSDMNRLSPAIADFIGKASSVPFLKQLVPEQLKTLQGSADAATKNAAISAIAQAVEQHISSRAPAAVISQENKTVADPTLAPGAKFKILQQQVAKLERTKDYYSDWLRDSQGGNLNNVPAWTSDWGNEKEHAPSAYLKRAINEVPYFAGMTPREIAETTDPDAGGRSRKNWDDGQQVIYKDPKTNKKFIGIYNKKNGTIEPIR